MEGVKFSVSISGLKNLQRRCDRLLTYDDRLQRFIEKLGDLGFQVAVEKFDNAIYDGYNDVDVIEPFWESENELVLMAVGSKITFIEFGSGTNSEYNSGDNVHPLADTLGMTRGDFGYKLGRLSSWRYRGFPGTNGIRITSGRHKGEILTKGNPANRCMYDSAQEMRKNIVKLAKEVFKK